MFNNFKMFMQKKKICFNTHTHYPCTFILMNAHRHSLTYEHLRDIELTNFETNIITTKCLVVTKNVISH